MLPLSYAAVVQLVVGAKFTKDDAQTLLAEVDLVSTHCLMSATVGECSRQKSRLATWASVARSTRANSARTRSNKADHLACDTVGALRAENQPRLLLGTIQAGVSEFSDEFRIKMGLRCRCPLQASVQRGFNGAEGSFAERQLSANVSSKRTGSFRPNPHV
ncbi:hypothetical protein GCM10011390_21210 [Aureimonas endophytica]|uniref:Uncharacterized protein n=1 Tax=Aureimonas endophytica TaxID=2027858 RepID=A0A917E577_9HYPH|nr:hypothetical protein GCM10011390_21210 [Aureimonas endophytica]